LSIEIFTLFNYLLGFYTPGFRKIMFANLVSQIRLAASSRSRRLSRLPVASYYLSRLVINPLIRRSIVAVLGKCIGKNSVEYKKDDSQLNALKQDGIVRLDKKLSNSQCSEIATYLSSKLVHNRNCSVRKNI